jgi:hypothetical protein
MRQLAAWVLAACLAALPLHAEEPVTLTPAALLQAGQEALAARQVDVALRVADALLTRDPDDLSARLLRAQARRAAGDTAGAAEDGRILWRAADTAEERFAAAMVTAQALSTGGNRLAAQWWLRRATEVAPNDNARAVAVRDFRYVRSRNPVTLQFTLQAAPSSNVNGGSANDRMNFYGWVVELSGDAQALSGFEATLGVEGAYRFGQTEAGHWEATFAASQRAVVLSGAAQEQAPNAQGSDYDYASVSLGFGHKGQTGSARHAVGVTLAHNWYGGADLSDTLAVEGSLDRPLSERFSLSLGASVERQWRRTGAPRSDDVLSLRGGGTWALAGGDRVSAMLTGRRTWSVNPEVANDALTLRLGWDKAEPLALGVTLSGGVTLGLRDYDRSRYAPGGRSDRTVGVDVALGLTGVDYMGFTPQIDLRAARTDSNVGLFDSNDLGVGISVKSAF